ncbi:MAG: HEAT repeat domain-containing protein [Gemmatimonadota bacterium]
MLLLVLTGFAGGLPACSPDTGQDRRGDREAGSIVSHEAGDTTVEIAELDRIGPGAKTDREALHRLVGAIRDPRHAVATRAAYWLGQAGSQAVPSLVEVLADSSVHARLSACYALGLVGTGAQRSVAALTRQLGGASDSVANMADWALTQILGSRRATLVEQLRDLRYGTTPERSASASSLALLGEGAADAIPLLVRYGGLGRSVRGRCAHPHRAPGNPRAAGRTRERQPAAARPGHGCLEQAPAPQSFLIRP